MKTINDLKKMELLNLELIKGGGTITYIGPSNSEGKSMVDCRDEFTGKESCNNWTYDKNAIMGAFCGF